MNDKKIISTGIATLDKTIMGFYPANLIVVGGRPGMGKSTFMLNVAHHIACSKKHKVAIFSLEMSKEEIQKHFLSYETHIPRQKIQDGDLTEGEQARLKDASDALRDMPIVVDNTPNITASEIKEKIRQMENVDIVFIDYLQLINYNPATPMDSAKTSRELKMMATELHIPVVVSSQLRRTVDKRADRRPVLNDLHAYGSISQDADLVLFLYRDGYYLEKHPVTSKEKDTSMEIIVAKNRNGKISTVNVCFNSELESYKTDLLATVEPAFTELDATGTELATLFARPNLNEKQIFENFEKTDKNAQALNTALRFANDEDVNQSNILLLQGGEGKTHLLNAIGNRYLQKHPTAKVRFLTAKDFMEAFHFVLEKNINFAFKKELLECDLLLLDNVEDFRNKEISVLEICHVIDTLCQQNKKNAFASSIDVSMLDIPDKFRRRLQRGEIADL